MAKLKVRILTQLTARPDREIDLRNLLLQFKESRCYQVGCNSYEVLQHQVNSAHFILVEDWDTEARLNLDLYRQTFAGLFEQGAALILEPPQIDWYDITET